MIYAYAIDEFTDSADDLVAVHEDRARLAEQYANAALAIDPGTLNAYRARAIVGARSWRWDIAQQAYESTLEHSPNDVLSLSEFARLRAWPTREAPIRQAHRARPDSVIAYLAVGDEEAAYRTLERAVTHLGPGSGYSLCSRSETSPTLDEPRFVQLRKLIRPRQRAPN